jgi:hypothetical protein
MSDGNILKNSGSGWKLYRKLKAGIDPEVYAVKFQAFTDGIPQAVKDYVQALPWPTPPIHIPPPLLTQTRSIRQHQ